MTQQNNSIEMIEHIQTTQKNIKTYTGVIIGMLLIFYFFSFASLLDKAPAIFFLFELVTSIIFVVILILLNKFSFKVTRWHYRNKPAHTDLLNKLSPSDVDKSPEILVKDIT